MFNFLQDIGNYEDRKVGKEEVNNFIISTAYTSDEGYETAIIDENGTHPIERYSDIIKAKEGHQKWIKKAKEIKTGDEIIKLGGWSGLVEDKKIKLLKLNERRTDNA